MCQTASTIQTTKLLIILTLTLMFNIYKHRVDEWTGWQVDKVLGRKIKNRQGKGKTELQGKQDWIKGRQSNKEIG